MLDRITTFSEAYKAPNPSSFLTKIPRSRVLSAQMSEAIPERISLFRSQLENRRFGDGTLRILESILVSKDVKSLLATRSALRELLRSETVSVLREVTEKHVEHKLCIVEFLVQAFALVGDVESCLTLKYEALVLRELKCMKDHSLQVQYDEWLTFAEDSFDNGYCSIAVKAFDNALLCIESRSNVDRKLGAFITMAQMVERIKNSREKALALVASHSVQTQTAEYLKVKSILQQQKLASCSTDTGNLAISVFRNGIKKRNMRNLLRSQGTISEVQNTSNC